MRHHLTLIAVFAALCSLYSCSSFGIGDVKNSEATEPSATVNKKRHEPEAEKKIRATAVQILAIKQVPVLCYHRIRPGANDEYSVTPTAFAAQMKILADSGYQTILPDQLYNYLVYNEALPEKPVMISFDDSRLEHATIAAPEMEKHNFKGVFFLMTISLDRKNYMSREQVAELANKGNTMALHTWDHHNTTQYTEEDWVKQTDEPKAAIEKITGKALNYFAYPFGIWNHTGAEALDKRNYKLSFILSTSRDSTLPLQTVRRMIVPSHWSPQGMLGAMHSTFSKR